MKIISFHPRQHLDTSSELRDVFLLPHDVILHILSRLRVESLVSFKSLRTFPDTLLSDKYFVQLYNEKSWENPMVLLIKNHSGRCLDKLGLSAFKFSLGFLKDDVNVRASCNGLLCCSSIKTEGVYYVCNPLTREFKLLPKIEEISRHTKTVVDLTVDSYTQRYNVVLVVLAGSDTSHILRLFNYFVYDSQTNAWKKKVVFGSLATGALLCAQRDRRVAVGHTFYWLSASPSPKILVFDMSNDALKRITLPGELAQSYAIRVYLLELEGSLSVINLFGEWMHIWVLKDSQKEEWELADRVNLRSISKDLRQTAFPVTLSGDFIFLRTFRDVWVYHRKSKEWEKVHNVSWSADALPFRGTVCSC